LVKDEEWLHPAEAPPLRIGGKLEIVTSNISKRSKVPRLHIPRGMAFGSGDHGTTAMLLRALTQHKDWAGTRVLDLGTGSGVLALTARLFGARKIVATDFDAVAVRIARENEALNFSTGTIRWQCADVKRLKVRTGFDLVTANLFSEILCTAAPQIVASVASGGQLWLSGILRSQKEQVTAAYRRQKLKLEREVSRGKWVLLQWRKTSK
jgi:ribosomal protein L11 methyltransferase